MTKGLEPTGSGPFVMRGAVMSVVVRLLVPHVERRRRDAHRRRRHWIGRILRDEHRSTVLAGRGETVRFPWASASSLLAGSGLLVSLSRWDRPWLEARRGFHRDLVGWRKGSRRRLLLRDAIRAPAAQLPAWHNEEGVAPFGKTTPSTLSPVSRRFLSQVASRQQREPA